MMKQQIDLDKCNNCGLCEKKCSMDIRLLEYAKINKQVLSSGCILCNTCINACPTKAIRISKRFDIGWLECLNMRDAG